MLQSVTVQYDRNTLKCNFSLFELFLVRKFGKLIKNNYNYIVMWLLHFCYYGRDLKGDLF